MLIACLAVWPTAAPAAQEALHDILHRGIEATFAGDYDRAETIFETLKTEHPAHPARAFYQAVVLFWRNNVDAANPRYTKQIRRLLEQAMRQAELMLIRDENDVEALHYLGLSYTYLGRLEAHSGSLYKGGVLGEKGRGFLERAIAICDDPTVRPLPGESENCSVCEDLYFPFGAYAYFAGRLPQLLRWLNFLWFIPSGSTEEGLAALDRVHEGGCLHRLGTKSLMVGIFLNFETDRLSDARRLSEELVTRFPDNPFLELQHARLLLAAGEHQRGAVRAGSMIEKCDRKRRNYDNTVRQAAVLVIIEAAIRQGDTLSARRMLNDIANEPSFLPNSLTPYADLLWGMTADIEKQREKAVAHYKQAMSYKGSMRNRTVTRKAKHYLAEPFSN